MRKWIMVSDPNIIALREKLHSSNISYREQKDQRDRELKEQIANRRDENQGRQIALREQHSADRKEQKELAEDTKRHITELQLQQQPEIMRLGHDLQLEIIKIEKNNWFNREDVYEQGRIQEFERDKQRLSLLHNHAKELAEISLSHDCEIRKEQSGLDDAQALQVRTHEIEMSKLQAVQVLDLEYQKNRFVIEAKNEESSIKQKEMLAEFKVNQQALKEAHNRAIEEYQDEALREVAVFREKAKIEMIREKFTADLTIQDRGNQTDEELRLQDGLVDVRHRERLLIQGLNQNIKNEPQEIDKPTSNEEPDPLNKYRSK